MNKQNEKKIFKHLLQICGPLIRVNMMKFTYFYEELLMTTNFEFFGN